MYAPPVVDEDVEDGQCNDQERRGPLSLETDCNHDACRETNEGHQEPNDTPFTPNHETNEKEDKEDTTGQQETVTMMSLDCQNRASSQEKGNALFLAVCFAERRKTGKKFLAGIHGVAEDHQETTDDGQVAKEEVEVEDEAVTDCLHNDNTEETAYCVF